MVRKILASALLALIAGSSPAWAHKLKVFAMAEGSEIVGTAYFSGGGYAAESRLTLIDPSGTAIAETRTDAEGAFRLSVSRRQDYRIRVDSQDGHMAEFVVAAEDLPSILPQGAAADPIAPSTAPAVSDISPSSAEIEKAIARQIRPLREQLDAYEDRLHWQDVIGGIGYICGLFGLWALFGRRRGKE